MQSTLEHKRQEFKPGQAIELVNFPQPASYLNRVSDSEILVSIPMNAEIPKRYLPFHCFKDGLSTLTVPLSLIKDYLPPVMLDKTPEAHKPTIDTRGLTGNPDFHFGGDGFYGYGNILVVKRYLAAGLNCIPIARGLNGPPANGYKCPPKGIKWGIWKQQTISYRDVNRYWLNVSPHGIGIPCGAVSGNLECLDFDTYEYFLMWREAVEKALPDLLPLLMISATPSNGRHVLYRCEKIQGNQKLAQELVGTKPNGEPDVATHIETRGEGGQFVAPGSPADCHPDGIPYLLVQGTPETLPTISTKDRETLLEIARGFNKYVKKQTTPKRAEPRDDDADDVDAPWNDFNERGNWQDILEPKGWQLHSGDWERGFVTRPGKRVVEGHSATVGHCGNMLHVFSSSAHPFEPEGTYSKASAWAHLYHEGDYSSSAKDLIGLGYGGVGRQRAAEKMLRDKFEEKLKNWRPK